MARGRLDVPRDRAAVRRGARRTCGAPAASLTSTEPEGTDTHRARTRYGITGQDGNYLAAAGTTWDWTRSGVGGPS